MANKYEELDYIAAKVTPLVLENLKANSQGVSEIEVVSDLDGVNTLPALKRVGGVEKVVEAPLALLRLPIEDQVAEAAAAAEDARDAAGEARAAAQGIGDLKDAAVAATNNANAAAERADAAVEAVAGAGDRANTAADAAESVAAAAAAQIIEVKEEFDQFISENESTVDTMLGKYTGEFAELQQEMQDATASAQDTADHPTRIGTDHYVYEWNKQTQAYDKTDIFTKGEGFSTKKTYTSEAQMHADYNNPDIPIGSYVGIVAGVENPANAQIWIKGQSAYEFWLDLSGAQGFEGKTPQFFAGTIQTGAPGTAVSASLSDYGYDEQGNPRYKINLTIPRGANGKPLIVMSNGNIGTWNEATGQYVDSGMPAAVLVAIDDVPIEFQEAAARENIESGESVPTAFGKLRKWLSSLKGLAFKDKVNICRILIKKTCINCRKLCDRARRAFRCKFPDNPVAI